MSSSFVLWIVGTSVAASADDPRLAAATDGTRVFITRDGGHSWQRVLLHPNADDDVDVDGDGGGGDDGDGDDVPATVHALAFLGSDLLVATSAGLLHDGRVVCALPLDALAVEERVLWAAAEGSLWRSDDGGRAFHLAGALPSPVTSLAVAGRRILTAGHDPLVTTVAAAPDGTFFRATAAGVERSADARAWRRVAPVSVRALAVGAGDVWLASGHRVLRLSEVEAWDRERPPVAQVHFDPGAVARRAGWAGLLPEVSLLARVAEGLGPGPRERVVGVTLTWSLDDDSGPSIQRTAADLWRARQR